MSKKMIFFVTSVSVCPVVYASVTNFQSFVPDRDGVCWNPPNTPIDAPVSPLSVSITTLVVLIHPESWVRITGCQSVSVNKIMTMWQHRVTKTE